MRQPLISVIMPAYNAKEYIGKAVKSILTQTYKTFELIIVDDHSTDTTLTIIKSFKDKRIKVITNKINLKLAKSLNKAIKQARGKYIARMDADDISLPKRLEKQVKFLEKHTEVGIVGGTMEIINDKGNIVAYRTYALMDKKIRDKMFRFSPFSHPSVMIRKSVLHKVGLYKPEYNPAEDYELYFRIGTVSLFANLKDILIKYRVVAGSMTTGGMRSMEIKTIQIRNAYATNKHYTMSILDKLYNWLQYYSLYLIPANIRMWLFNTIRNSHNL